MGRFLHDVWRHTVLGHHRAHRSKCRSYRVAVNGNRHWSRSPVYKHCDTPSYSIQVRGWLLWPGVTLMFVDSMVNLLISVSWKSMLPQSVAYKLSSFWRPTAQREDRLSLLRESLVAEHSESEHDTAAIVDSAAAAAAAISSETFADVDARLVHVGVCINPAVSCELCCKRCIPASSEFITLSAPL
jgi:hypothetical protein